MNITTNGLGKALHEGLCVICGPGHIAWFVFAYKLPHLSLWGLVVNKESINTQTYNCSMLSDIIFLKEWLATELFKFLKDYKMYMYS